MLNLPYFLIPNSNDFAGEDPEVFNDNLEPKLNDDILQTNTNDNNDNSNDQVQNENQQVVDGGDGINGMGDLVTVVEEEIKVEPAGKELEASFFEKDDIVVNESPEIIEKLEETLDTTSTENMINENVSDGKWFN